MLLLACAACEIATPSRPPAASPITETSPPLPEADTAFTSLSVENAEPVPAPAPRLTYDLAVLHVLIPRQHNGAMEKIWNFLREDALDAETRLRLRQNGLRVGVGHARWWGPLKAAMDAIDDHRVLAATPVRVPVGFPLSLELDFEPREQTLFCVGADGILSGGTWPDSRNVLRVTYGPDPQDAERVLLLATPEVHQQRRGWEWVRTESGLWQVPRQAMESFGASGFAVTLGPGEFVLVAPSENAHVYGLLGRAFLTRECEGRPYSSYVFLRPQARHVGQHD